ncbi:MAG: right-handed parallel beta-helix repeat-containing protein [Bdellovibrionota bacterium]
MNRFLAVLAAGGLGLFCAFSAPMAAQAATFTVNDTGDGADLALDGVCEVTASTGDCTLRAAIQEANSVAGADTINFDSELNGAVITLGGALPTITGDLTVTGPGAGLLTIDADDDYAVFGVDSEGAGATVSLSGMSLFDGIQEGAALLYVGPTDTVSAAGVYFVSGYVIVGAIYNEGTLTVTNSKFIGNQAVEGGDGAAILNNGGTVTITGTDFIGNYAESDGGAIYNDGGTLTVTGGSFKYNSAGCEGGAIFNDEGDVTITGVTFDQNQSDGCDSGGAIYSGGGSLTVSGSTFTDNEANFGSGGAIASYDSILDVDESVFSGNQSSWGGAISAAGGDGEESLAADISIAGSTFEDNDGGEGGGAVAIEVYYVAGTVSISENTMTSNYAYNGGAVFVYFYDSNATVLISGSTLSGNEAYEGGSGGGLYVYDNNENYVIEGNVSITDSTISGNTASSSGGGIYTSDSLTLINTAVDDNVASFDNCCEYAGGGIYFGSESGSVTILGGSVSGNSAYSSDGGGIYFSSFDGTLDITGAVIDGNYSDSSGGGIYFNTEGGEFTLTASTVSNNEAGGTSGVHIDASEATVEQSSIIGNGGGEGPGGLYFEAGEGTLVNSTVSGNTSYCSPGGVQNVDLLTILHATITQNVTDLNGFCGADGGGLYSSEGTTTVTSSIIAGNFDFSSEGGANIYPDISAIITSGGTNVIGDSEGVSGLDPSDVVDVDALLGALISATGDPGTWVHPLLPESPAIGLAAAATCPTDDQLGYDRDAENCDAGAVVADLSVAIDSFTAERGEGGAFTLSWTALSATGCILLTPAGVTPVDTEGTLEVSAPAGTTYILICNGEGGPVTAQVTLGGGGSSGGCSLGSGSRGGPGSGAGLLLLAVAGMFFLEKLRKGRITMKRFPLLLALLAVLAAPLAAPLVARAATFTVDDTGDDSDFNAGDGICEVFDGEGVCTLRAAIQEANALGGADGIDFGIGGTISLSDWLPNIEDDLAISGPGAQALRVENYALSVYSDGNAIDVSVSGLTLAYGENNSGALLYVGYTDQVAVTGVVFDNGFATDDGGAVYIEGDGELTVNDSDFFGSNADGSGGAIYNDGGTLTVVGGSFVNNEAYCGDGGAIYNDEGDVTIIGATFEDNEVGDCSDGGAIASYYGSLTVRDSIFTDNDADDNGGAIYAYSGEITIEGSTFLANDADYGGAIYIEANGDNLEASIAENVFEENEAAAGGAVYVGLFESFGAVAISDSTFTSNYAWDEGGGALYYDLMYVAANLTLSGSTLDQNGAYNNGNGGAIYVYTADGGDEDGTVLTISDSTISGNSAYYYGGGIYTEDSLTLISTAVEDNVASFDNCCEYAGGGIYSSSGYGDLTILGGSVSGNEMFEGYGGGIFFYTGDGDLEITGAIIDGNGAYDGAGIYFGAEGSGEFTLTASTVSNNEGDGGTGGVAIYYGPAIIEQSSIIGNLGDEYPGGIYVYYSDTTIVNSTVSGNASMCSGGGIYNYGSLEILHSTITENLADASFDCDGYGGGIFNSGDLLLTSSIVAGNFNFTNGYPDVVDDGGFLSGGTNVIGNGNGVGEFDESDVVGEDPLLGALISATGDPGTWVHPLLPGSPAIGLAAAATCPDEDQLGLEREADDCDAGAVVSNIPVAILSFAVTPEEGVQAGETATLSWETAGATACVIVSPTGVTPVDASGTLDVTPLVPTVYLLVCNGEDGPVTEELAVTVNGMPPSSSGCELSPQSRGGLGSEGSLLLVAIAGAFYFERRRRARARG